MTDADRPFLVADDNDFVPAVAVEIGNADLFGSKIAGEGFAGVESFASLLAEDNHLSGVGIGDDDIDPAIAVHVAGGQFAGTAGGATTDPVVRRLQFDFIAGIRVRLHTKDFEPTGRRIDCQQCRRLVQIDAGHGDTTRIFRIEAEFGAQPAVASLQSRADGLLVDFPGEVHQVIAVIAIQIADHRDRELFGGIADLDRRLHPAIFSLVEEVGGLFAEHRQIITPVVVEVAGGNAPRGRIHAGQAELLAARPAIVFGLMQNQQSVRFGNAGQIDPTVTIEVTDRHRGDGTVDGELAVLEPPVTVDAVDVRTGQHGRLVDRRPLLPLNEQINAAVAVVDQRDISPAVTVEITAEQRVTPPGELEDLDRQESKRASRILRSIVGADGTGPDDHHEKQHRGHRHPATPEEIHRFDIRCMGHQVPPVCSSIVIPPQQSIPDRCDGVGLTAVPVLYGAGYFRG